MEAVSLPEFLKILFWDVDFDQLDSLKDRNFVVARVAEYGTDEAVRWLRKTYSNNEIAQALEASLHLVSQKTIGLWKLWLNRPEDWCKEIPSRPLRGNFWRS